MGMYELLTFTKHKVDDEVMKDENSAFKKIAIRLCSIFASIWHYSYQAKLEPGDTCEIPDKEGEENICLILDEYKTITLTLLSMEKDMAS